MPVGDVFRASAVFTAPNAAGEMVVTFHYRLEATPVVPEGTSEAQSLANKVRGQIQTTYLPILADSVTFQEVNVIGITDPTLAHTAPDGNLGQLNEGNVSYRSTVIARNNTGLRGRTFSGYQQYIAPTEQQQSNGVLSAGFLTSMQTHVDAMLELGTFGIQRVWQQVVYSRKLSAATVIDSVTVRDRQGSNKRRQDTSG